MKKLFALVLAVVLVMAMSANAMAAEVNENGGSSTGNVTVTVKPYEGDDVYVVNINWESLKFTYTNTGWDDEKLEYTGSWDKTEADITVTNNSNVSIKATPYAPEDKDLNDNVSFSISDLTPVPLGIGNSCTYTVVVDGKPANQAANYTAATIKIVIAKA